MDSAAHKKWLTWGLLGFTLILLLTGLILFFRLKSSAKPTPRAMPKASPKLPVIQQQVAEEVCSLAFSVSASPSPSPSPNPSSSPSPSASPKPIACFDTCVSDIDCEDDLRCMSVSGTKRCVNPTCVEEADCVCASPNPSASPQAKTSPSPVVIAQASPSPRTQTPALPQAGVNTPMVLGVSAGILMMVIGLLF